MAGGATAKNAPAWFQTVGTLLALCSGLFIGLSLILQKKGLLDSNAQRLASGNEFSYLKSNYWWLGIACMVIGEFSNFAAYAFSPAIIVTPLGAVSVVVSAVLSILFLGEQLNFSGACGIVLCIIGSIIIVFHGPRSTATETLDEFYIFLVKPGFIIYCFLAGGLLVWLYWKIVPRYGTTQPIVYVSMTSIAGAFLVNAAQGLGSSVVYSIRNWETDNQFVDWRLYPLAVFVGASAIFQVLYLNKSLQHFSTSIVTPVYYVFFSTATLITSAVLFQGFNVSSFINGATIVLGFLVIVIGVALLFQYNLKLNKLAQKEPKMNTDTSMLPDISASSIDEPQTDQNPFTLMAMTFPFRTSHGQEDGRSDVALNLEQELIVAAGIKNNVPARLSASNIDFTPLDKSAAT